MFSRISFQRKVFIYYSIFITSILLVLALIFYSYISSILFDREVKSMKQSVEKISAGLDSMLKEIDTVTTQVLFSKDIQEIMADSIEFHKNGQNYYEYNFDSAKKARNILVSINSIKSTVRRICIFNENGDYVSVGKAVEYKSPPPSFFKNTYLYENMKKTYDRSVIIPPHKDEFILDKLSPLVISFRREMFATYGANNNLGFVEVQQPYEMVEGICNTGDKSSLKIIIFDENGNIIYPVNKYSKSEAIYYYSLNNISGKTLTRPSDNTEELVYINNLSYTSWKVIASQPKHEFMSPVYFLRNIFLIFGFLLIVLTLFIMYLISKGLTAPIREMRVLVKKLSLENLSINLSNHVGNNEVALLNEAFNKTLSRLKESMEQTIQARAGEAHAHLLALQAQMNPHFLYNTLMGISGLANEEANYKVVSMCSELSDMLRYVASFDSTDITIKDELQHAENYLKLNKWRFEDLLEYRLSVDQSLFSIKVPKLILQPIVENSFVHGFKNQPPPFRVEITGHAENGKWFIKVSDNGCGFNKITNERILSQVQQYTADTHSGKIFDKLEIGGLGMINIYMRLRLLYGNDVIFNIFNKPEGGSTVVIGGSIKD